MIVLSQNNCVNCVKLKQYLKFALGQEFVEIKREENEQAFNEYVEKYHIMSTPALIKGEKCLVGFVPSQVEKFIKE